MNINVNGPVEIEEKPHYDYHRQGEEKILEEIDYPRLCDQIASGEIEKDDLLFCFLVYLARWKAEVVRKRFYRRAKKDGQIILSDEEWFEKEDGLEVIDGFERTGRVAFQLLYNLWPDRAPKVEESEGSLHAITPSPHPKFHPFERRVEYAF